MILDDAQTLAQLDSDHMLDRIGELPEQCRTAWDQTRQLTLPEDFGAVDHIVIVGMGGSAIGGALLQDLVSDHCQASISLVRDYELPAFVASEHTLVIACSYSGNTEETLSCTRQALEAGVRTMALTTGGKLAELAGQAGAPVVEYDYQSQPRAALGYSFILLLGAVHRLGLVRDFGPDLSGAAKAMETWQSEITADVPLEENEAKQLARRIQKRLPIVYGAGFLTATANRWKTQFNENAKSWSFFEFLPELNHNAVVGLGIPDGVRENAFVVVLRSDLDRKRIRERWDVTQEVLAREGVTAHEVWGRGDTKLAHILSLIHFGDYVSYYLAALYGVDPTPVETIAFLKHRLAEFDADGD